MMLRIIREKRGAGGGMDSTSCPVFLIGVTH